MNTHIDKKLINVLQLLVIKVARDDKPLLLSFCLYSISPINILHNNLANIATAIAATITRLFSSSYLLFS